MTCSRGAESLIVFESESWGSQSPNCSTSHHHFFTTVNTNCEGYCFE
jgi:hypothetical protein